ncbi:helix-turn-helix transcriptional regulator [Alkalicella caledoniensis]|uniref:Helix-turn-helix transcriptional regulator n=1 Tax=Alkalicella caledoniensis TaxID=2731377 RepID=A0A7G9W594_ALKCA|nr:helix-turn-helix domain-containing protein [Alkalicella caledoniensis]QNO13856.1 helix-turn-helix transcriptional regulator [Alkalicella caledoniensis]
MYYNLLLFGDKFKSIRENLKLTREMLSDLSGVHVETIRRIEKGGARIPKSETLEILSFFMKEDLNLILFDYRIDDYSLFKSIRNSLENKLNEGNFDLSTEIIELKKMINPSINNYNQVFIKQLILLAEGIISYRKKDYNNSFEKFNMALTQNTPFFDVNDYKGYIYSPMEIRILMNLAFVLNKLGKTNLYLEILEFCITNQNSTDIIDKLCHNLSSAFLRTGEYEKALKYSKMGVEYCEEKLKVNGLHILYYGKGLAEYYLNNNEYLKSINKAIFLCDLFRKDDFKKIILNSTCST